jgi:23S rRNA pseudouridine2457 synthase
MRYFAFHKPYGYLSQFTDEGRWKGLAQLSLFPSEVYPIGRLDADSEGLLLLSSDSSINARLLHPKNKHERSYLVQVEGEITAEAIEALQGPLELNYKGKIHITAAAKARKIKVPEFLEERDPPVRFRKSVPSSWIELILTEGKNRQVRKMTAKVGFPTLRLLRKSIEGISMDRLPQGQIKEYSKQEFESLLRL